MIDLFLKNCRLFQKLLSITLCFSIGFSPLVPALAQSQEGSKKEASFSPQELLQDVVDFFSEKPFSSPSFPSLPFPNLGKEARSIRSAFQALAQEPQTLSIIDHYNQLRYFEMVAEHEKALFKTLIDFKQRIFILYLRARHPGALHQILVENGTEIDTTQPPNSDELTAAEQQFFKMRDLIETQWLPQTVLAAQRAKELDQKDSPDIPTVLSVSSNRVDALEALVQNQSFVSLENLKTVPFSIGDEELDPRIAEARAKRYAPIVGGTHSPPPQYTIRPEIVSAAIQQYFDSLFFLYQMRIFLEKDQLDTSLAWTRQFDLRVTTRQMETNSGIAIFDRASRFDTSGRVIVVDRMAAERLDDQVIHLNFHPQTLITARAQALSNWPSRQNTRFRLMQYIGFNHEMELLKQNFLVRGLSLDQTTLPPIPPELKRDLFGDVTYQDIFGVDFASQQEPLFRTRLQMAGTFLPKIEIESPIVNPDDLTSPEAAAAAQKELDAIAQEVDHAIRNNWAPKMARVGLHITDFDLAKKIASIIRPSFESNPNLEDQFNAFIEEIINIGERAEHEFFEEQFQTVIQEWRSPLSVLKEDPLALEKNLRAMMARAKVRSLYKGLRLILPDYNEGTPQEQQALMQIHGRLQDFLIEQETRIASSFSPSIVTIWAQKADQFSEEEVFARIRKGFFQYLVRKSQILAAIDEQHGPDVEIDVEILYKALNEFTLTENTEMDVSPQVQTWLARVLKAANEAKQAAAQNQFASGGLFFSPYQVAQAEYHQILNAWVDFYLDETVGVPLRDGSFLTELRTSSGVARTEIVEALLSEGLKKAFHRRHSNQVSEITVEDHRKDIRDWLSIGNLFGFLQEPHAEHPDVRLLSDIPAPEHDLSIGYRTGLTDSDRRRYHRRLRDETLNQSSILDLRLSANDSRPLYEILAKEFPPGTEDADLTVFERRIAHLVDQALLIDEDRVKKNIASISHVETVQDMDEAVQKIIGRSVRWHELAKTYPTMTGYEDDIRYQIFLPSARSYMWNHYHGGVSRYFGLFVGAMLGTGLTRALPKFLTRGATQGVVSRGLNVTAGTVGQGFGNAWDFMNRYVPWPVFMGIIGLGVGNAGYEKFFVSDEFQKDSEIAYQFARAGLQGDSLYTWEEYLLTESERLAHLDRANRQFYSELGMVGIVAIGGYMASKWMRPKKLSARLNQRVAIWTDEIGVSVQNNGKLEALGALDDTLLAQAYQARAAEIRQLTTKSGQDARITNALIQDLEIATVNTLRARKQILSQVDDALSRLEPAYERLQVRRGASPKEIEAAIQDARANSHFIGKRELYLREEAFKQIQTEFNQLAHAHQTHPLSNAMYERALQIRTGASKVGPIKHGDLQINLQKPTAQIVDELRALTVVRG